MSKATRDKILATTSSLLERQGYHATGLAQIVSESATPRGSLYYYFPDGKEELASEAVALRMRATAEFARRFLGEINDPVEAVYAMIMDMAEKMSKQGCGTGAPIAAVALEASNSSERIRKACADGYQGLQEVLAAKLVMGGFSAERASSLAMTINASIEGGMVLSRTKHDSDILVSIADDMKFLLRSALQASG